MRSFNSALFATLWTVSSAVANDKMIVVVGAPGESEFGDQFAEWARDWQGAAKAAAVEIETIGPSEKDREQLQERLAAERKDGNDALWLVLLGHGTFDGGEAKFNLRGADVSAREFKGWLAPFKRPLVLLDFSAASAPFLAELSGPRRVIITATRNGTERNFAHFGGFFSKAIASAAADLDKDGQTSVLEAFLSAAHSVTAFYESEQRIATEHALLDDNGDRRGTPPDAFERLEPVRVTKSAAAPDGAVARETVLLRSEARFSPEQLAKSKQVEASLDKLRKGKAKMAEAEYYQRLEALLLDLARIDRESERKR